MDSTFGLCGLIGLIALVIVGFIMLYSSVYIIQPYEQAVYVRLGKFIRLFNPGYNLAPPLISQVIRFDLRTQVLDVPRQEVITRDNSPTNVDAIIYIKVVDPKKAYHEVSNYKLATVALAQTTLRSVIGDMELDEILYNREKINTHLRDILDEATDAWGVKVEAVEIKEVDPVGPVKSAMEEQTAAERQRRAAILRADGEKKAAILQAEGNKRARILQAEGVRQSAILEADGQRQARILQAQGEAQRLRILSLGSATLDQKSLTVLSLDTLTRVGNGKATKIIFPFEVSRMFDAASRYISGTEATKEREVSEAGLEELERYIGKPDDVLGPIPSTEKLREEMKEMEKEIEAESAETTETVTRMTSRGR